MSGEEVAELANITTAELSEQSSDLDEIFVYHHCALDI